MAWHYVKSSSELVDDRASAPVNGRWPTAERLHVTPVQRALVVGGGHTHFPIWSSPGVRTITPSWKSLSPAILNEPYINAVNPPGDPLDPPPPMAGWKGRCRNVTDSVHIADFLLKPQFPQDPPLPTPKPDSDCTGRCAGWIDTISFATVAGTGWGGGFLEIAVCDWVAR